MIKRNNNLDKNKTINRRLFILGTAKVGLLGLITSRLYNLQISEKKKYELLSDKTKDEIIDEINKAVDIPIISEKTEKAILEALWKIIKGVLLKRLGV